jgi:hypothetical protein
MLYRKKSFQVPASVPTKRPCAIHHFDKRGNCLRCPEKIRYTVTDKGKAELTNGDEGPE